MGLPYTKVPWPFPWRGLMTELHAKHLPPDALASCSNMFYVNPGLLRGRGTIAVGAAGTGVMYYWDFSDTLYTASSFGANVVDICSFGTGATPKLVVAENNSSGHTLHTFTYSGSAYAELTGTDVPHARAVMARADSRLWAANLVDYPSRVCCCSPGDYTVWTAAWDVAGFWDIAPSHDGDFVDWIDHNGTLYIFKDRGIYALTGDSPAGVSQQKVAKADSIKAGTVADCGRGVLYCTAYGVFPLGVAATAENNLARNNLTSITAFLAAGTPKAAYSPQLGCYIIVNGTTTAWALNLNNRFDVWTTFALPGSITNIYEGAGLRLASATNLYAYTHSGAPEAAASLKTGDWSFGDMLPLKNIREIEGDFNAMQNATAAVALYVDGSGTASQTSTFAYDAARQMDICNLNGERLALGVTYSTMTGPPAFGGAMVRVVPKGDIK